jgi:Zn-dependent oligopeptidase
MENPLLNTGGAGHLPAFDRIRPEDAGPALDAVLAENRARLTAVLTDPKADSWGGRCLICSVS